MTFIFLGGPLRLAWIVYDMYKYQNISTTLDESNQKLIHSNCFNFKDQLSTLNKVP